MFDWFKRMNPVAKFGTIFTTLVFIVLIGSIIQQLLQP